MIVPIPDLCTLTYLVFLMLLCLFIAVLWSTAEKGADLLALVGDVIIFFYLSMWYPGSGVVRDCIVF